MRTWPVFSSLLLLIASGAVVGWYQGQALDRELCGRLLMQAVAIARTIEPAQVESLAFSQADKDSPLFQQLHEQLMAYSKAVGLRRIFTYALRHGAILCGPDGTSDASQTGAIPGNSRPCSQEELDMFRRGEPFTQDSAADTTLACIRAWAPVKNPRTGKLLLMVGLELDSADRDRRVWNHRALPVLFSAGLALLLLSGRALIRRRAQLPPGGHGWLRFTEPLLTASLGGLLTLAAALLMREQEDAARRDLFLRVAESQTAVLKAGDWDIRDSLMVGMAKYLEDDRWILPDEFHYYVGSLVRGADVQALEWVPRVAAADKDKSEADARKMGLTNFFIFERSPTGQRMAAQSRDIYYPVLYAEPSIGNEQVLGFDLGSDSLRRAALEEAERTRLPTATDPIPLLQNRKGQQSLLVFHPIYLRESISSSGRETTKRLPVGFSTAVVHCNALLERALAYSAADGHVAHADWYQLDATRTAPVWLASWPRSPGPQGLEARGFARESLDSLRVIRPLFVFSKAYALVVTPEPAFLAAHPPRAALVTGSCGVALTTVGSILVGLMSGRRERLEQEVRTRTEMLRSSEESYRRQFSDSLAIMMLIDPEDGRIVEANGAAERFYGHPQERLRSMRIAQLSTSSEAQLKLAMTSVLEQARNYFEFTHCLSDGSTRFVEVYWSAILFANRRLLHSIIHDITERKSAEVQLQQVHQKLLVASREAGMAEVAISVLHNVGNVLNSVNVSASLVSERLKRSKTANLSQLADLFQQHSADLGKFLMQDCKGQKITQYLGELAKHFGKEQVALTGELSVLRSNIEHINSIVSMQQSYAKTGGLIELVNPADLIEDAMRINGSVLERCKIEVIREYDRPAVPQTSVDKHKVLQILVNLIRNAADACEQSGRPDKRLVLNVAKGSERISISVKDNGVGIPAENLTRIFSYGFTTRKNGHGFGLHSGSLTAKELGGSLQVQSDGVGQGATFTLEMPIK